MCPTSPGQELLEGPLCFLVSSLTSKEPGPTWASSQYLMTECKDHIQAEETSEEDDMSPRPVVLGSLVKWFKLQPQIRHYFRFQRICCLNPLKRELLCLRYSDLQKCCELTAS